MSGPFGDPGRGRLDPEQQRGVAGRVWSVTLLAIAACAIRLPHLTESLWFDEIWRTRVVLRPDNLRQLLLHDVHNPLYNLLMYGWTRLAGDSEIAIRLPSLAFGLGAILILHRWMTARLGATAANVAAAVLLLSPVHAWYSCEAKNNMLVLLLGVLTVVQTDLLLTRGRWTDGLLAALWSTLALLTSWQASLVVLPAWIAGAILAQRWEPATPSSRVTARRRLVVLGASAALTLAALLPLLVFKAGRVEELGRLYAASLNFSRLCKLLFIWYPTGNALVLVRPNQWPLWAAVFGIAVVPALALGVAALHGTSPGRLVLGCLLLPIAGLLVVTTVFAMAGEPAPRIYQERNTLVVLPWFIAALAVGAARAPLGRGLLIALLLALSLVSSIAAVTWRAGKSTVMNPNPDWRGVAALVRAAASAGAQPPVTVSCCPLLPLEYYPTPGRHVEIDWKQDVADQIDQQRRAHPASDVFFVNNPYWFGHPEDSLASLEARLGNPLRRDFQSLQVYHLPPINGQHSPHSER